MPMTETDLPNASSLYESSTVSSRAQLCGVFLTDSDTEMQWAKVLRLLLLVVGDRFYLLPSSPQIMTDLKKNKVR